jgi:uncharacterized protein
MNEKAILEETEAFVRTTLGKDETGHDWWHAHRVRQIAKRLGKDEGVDTFIVELSALLHDIADYKLHGGDESLSSARASDWLSRTGMSHEQVQRVSQIIESVSFMKSLPGRDTQASGAISKEAMVVADADRLDAMGALGIARTFAFGGAFRRPIHDPTEKPRQSLTREDYKHNRSTSINHFYEKLLKLKDMMHTESGRDLAAKRHAFMEAFLEEFLAEWEGKA